MKRAAPTPEQAANNFRQNVVETLSGECPLWVSKLAMKIAAALLPAIYLTRAFQSGLSAGILSAPNASQIIAEHASEIDSAIRSSKKFEGKNHTDILSDDATSQIGAEVMKHLHADPADRLAFFRGFCVGLSFEAETTKLAKRAKAAMKSGKRPVALHLLLWLRWREFEAMKTPGEVYDECRKVFAEHNNAAIVGPKANFRATWKRIRKAR